VAAELHVRMSTTLRAASRWDIKQHRRLS